MTFTAVIKNIKNMYSSSGFELFVSSQKWLLIELRCQLQFVELSEDLERFYF